jgi:16S rRNA G966 N2-methylase RsmD
MTGRATSRDKDVVPDEALKSILSDSGGPANRAIPATTAASKGSNAYQVHTYPTKVPPAAIEPFILACTEPNGIVLDPFCGSGMTGLAAQKTGRRAILSDLAPGAVHLAHNHTHPVSPGLLAVAMTRLTTMLAKLESELYVSNCPTCGRPGRLRHMIWTDVHTCAKCDIKIRVWDQTDETGSSSRTLVCECGHRQSRSGVSNVASEPVEKAVACSSCRKLQRGAVDLHDLALLASIAKDKLKDWMPSVPIGPDREMYRRSALHLRGITNVADFWNERSKVALSALWQYITEQAQNDVQQALRFAFTNSAWHATRMRRFNALGGQRPLTGTLYIPQLIAEGNVFEIFRHQVAQLSRFYAVHPALGSDDLVTLARRSSATDLSWLPSGSIDYVFTDPPFGANLFYGDCNIVWESWLGEVTDLEKEIVVNRSLPSAAGGKTITDYEKLLSNAFSEIHRTLLPSARLSVVFHNADDKVWSALLGATDRAGFVQTDVSVLDKVQRSMKGYKGRSGAELVPFYDLVITFVSGARASKGLLNGYGEIALDAVRTHLEALPSVSNYETQHERSLEYLYSLSVRAVVGAGHHPTGLSFRALERLLSENLVCEGRRYFLR